MAEDLDDAAAARRTLGGDRGAFEAIVRRHEGAVYAHLLRLTNSPEDAEDLAQETFVRAWRGLGSWRPAEPMRPWLLRIAYNAAMSGARMRHVQTVPLPDGAEEILPDTGSADRGDAEKREELLRRVEEAVRTLPPQSVALFDLRYREGLPLETIGATVGASPNAVAAALRRLRIRLREMVLRREKTGRGGGR